ncbi:MAG: AAA family ATPase [Desulfobacteraceae bacterium]|nr:AAA family ATPase [Desulfobacteraceae bacterium]
MSANHQPGDIDLLLQVLPPPLKEAVEREDHLEGLVEIVLDLGRLPEARFPAGMTTLAERPVTREDLDYVVSRTGTFSEDNRAGIERTLHRISAIRNRVGAVVGITCRVGRAIYGTVDILADKIESGRSMLLLGRPGVGKTTILREAARVLADDFGKRVVIVDTSNEIGGDGDIPHPGIGRARRMQVPSPHRQHAVMIEAVENHMPEVIVIDEIGTEAEALAARTIAERGVQLIATAHGNTLENLLRNPTLADLVGGVQVVTISDEEARRRGTRKSVLERKAPPTFTVLVEIQDKDRVAIHDDVATVVDAFLDGLPPEPEVRVRTPEGRVEVEREAEVATAPEALPAKAPPRRVRRRTTRVFTYAVSKSRLERAIQKLRAPAEIVDDINRADLLLTLKSQEKRQPRRVRELQDRGVPLHAIRSNTVTQIENFLRAAFDLPEEPEGEDAALQEAEAAVTEVFEKGHPVELSPRNPHIRALQHQLAQRYGLLTESKGRDPFRRVVVFPL